MQKKSESVFEKLSPFDNQTGELNVIIDTPKGSRNKYKYDENLGLFKLGGVLAVGLFFPFGSRKAKNIVEEGIKLYKKK